MRSARVPRTVAEVTIDDVQSREGGAPTRVWLEFDFDAEPIEGTLCRPGERPSPFFGWLGLTAALEGLRGGGEQRREGNAP